ncbi:ETX/MTX2 family pore-forming toxin [Bacillus thuringiensis]|uniref:ETX/MTX2 family pore-forming toxin n=1 Tax=Bacillus thuringiensis TaxID=1428 RepID=UPI0026E241FD|nr:ETX/MTX2 family pore-forming toxin [Bacillus thuringiensis]MDO6632227.1 ETX/MTX2 family pore-forming toxin [Bacillus thuringiensis]MDO6661730.1 ETX/MTX2 family pore-forming toxin [Bacillus thuringiensis]MDO6702474.1 ETX/MTX2 family pore-forming toxin [Bacillus thuringiensis]
MKFKKIMVSGMVLTYCTFFLSNGQVIQAEQVNPINMQIVQNKEAGIITNVDKQLNKISEYYYDKKLDWTILDGYRIIYLEDKTTNMKEFKMKAKDFTNIEYGDLNSEYIGENVFTNTTNQEQTYTTASYTHTFTNSVSTTVSNGFSVGGKTTIFKIPYVLPNGIDISPTINASTAETTTTTDTKTFTAPSQNVKVPPKKIYLVEVKFQKKSFQGNIDFSGSGTGLSSDLSLHMSWQGAGGRPNKTETKTYKTKNMWDSLNNSEKNNIEGVKFGNNDDFTVEGTASLKGIVGTKLEVTTYDITNKSNPVLISKNFY